MWRQNLKSHALLQVVDSLRKGHQAMVFVHSRKDTGKTARTLVTKAQNAGETDVFDCSEEPQYPFTQKEIKRSRNRYAAPERLRLAHYASSPSMVGQCSCRVETDDNVALALLSGDASKAKRSSAAGRLADWLQASVGTSTILLVLHCYCCNGQFLSASREIQDLFPGGIGIHHAGMLRSDRNLMEKAFADGMLKVCSLPNAASSPILSYQSRSMQDWVRS